MPCHCFTIADSMGGRKFRLIQRKRHAIEQHNRAVAGLQMSIPVKHVVHIPPLRISLPISAYFDSPIDAYTICSRIASLPMPPTWTLHSPNMPIYLCKLQTISHHPPKIVTLVTISITEELKLEWSFIHYKLNPCNCEALEMKSTLTVFKLSDIGDTLSNW